MSYKLCYAGIYFVLIGALFTFFSHNANANEISKHLSTIVEPEPIKRVEPKYPIDAARQGREGWTILSFVIDKQGSVSDVLVKDSSGSKDIDRASVKAVSKWKYQPAFENGKPIQQCVNTVQMNFSMGNSRYASKGVSRRFQKKYKIAIEALKNKEYEEVDKQLSLMTTGRNMHLDESNYMNLLAADYAKAKGDKPLQLSHLNRVSLHSSGANEPFQLSILYQRFSLQVELSQFQHAYTTYENLIKLDSAQPYKAELEKIITDIDTLIDSDKNIIIQAVMDEEHWYAKLVRSEFSLVDIKGSLHTLDVRCANKRELFTIKNNNTWTIPKSWKQCEIYVFGEQGTKFNFVEHPIITTAKL
jgi:TonB family protein